MAKRKTQEQFIEELKKVNKDIEPLEAYKSSKQKILLYCKICSNEWKATPHDLLSGHGCPICGYEKQKKAQRCSHEVFLQNLKNINADIDVLDEYVKITTQK